MTNYPRRRKCDRQYQKLSEPIPDRRPASGEVGTLAEQLRSLNLYLDLPQHSRLTSRQREYAWSVCRQVARPEVTNG